MAYIFSDLFIFFFASIVFQLDCAAKFDEKFFYHPMGEVKNILSSLKEHERKIYVIYANPVHKEIFLSAGFEEDFYLKKLHYLELSILLKEPGV